MRDTSVATGGDSIYGSLANQLFNWGHYVFAFLLLFVGIPRLMFHDADGTGLDRVVANYLRMVFFVIIVGFLLVLTKLYEVLGIVGAIGLWTAVQKSKGSGRTVAWSYVGAMIFDFAELPQIAWQFLRNGPTRLRTWLGGHRQRLYRQRWLSLSMLQIGLVLVVLGMTVYIRLYVAVTDPAPKLSDGDTLLAWIKYIDLRVLMHDGIYPQGFFFYMATLGKFAVINTLYILNFTGPLDSVFIVLMMFYAVRRFTGSVLGGLVAATLYGVMGHFLLSYEWTRQSGSETEEFGFFFIFPTLYFLNRYLRDGKRTDFWIAFSGLCDTGLVHPLSYGLNVMACVAAILAHTVARFYDSKFRALRCLVGGIVSVPITLLPYILAYIYHIQANQASQEFLQGKVSTADTSGAAAAASQPIITLAAPTGVDVVAIVSILFLLALAIRGLIRNRPNVVWLTAGLWGLFCYLTYEFGAYVTKSLVLSARMLDLWAVVEPFVIGIGVAALFEILKAVPRKGWIQGVGAVGFVSTAAVMAPPMPIRPYEVQWNADVDAYLHIDRHFRYTGYMIVSPDFEYALVLGDGFHMLTKDFLRFYNPTAPPLTRYGAARTDSNIAANVFVYDYKRIFAVSKSNSLYSMYLPEYEQEYTDHLAFQSWLRRYIQQNGRAYTVYYNSPELVVYEFIVKPTPIPNKTRS